MRPVPVPVAKQKPPGKPFTMVVILTIAVLFTVVGLIGLIFKDVRPATQQPTTTPHRTTEEMKTFWAKELQEPIGKLTAGKSPYPSINERFLALNKKVLEQTGHELTMNLSTNYHRFGTEVMASAGTVASNNTRHLSLYIPAIMDTFDMLRESGEKKWRLAFQSHMIAVVMHEAEHTVGNIRGSNRADIKEESRAWAETCRHTIGPLNESPEAVLFQSEWDVYQAWRRAHGDTNNIHWITEMQRMYGHLDGKAGIE
jgi:hypothetical protein